MWAGGFSFLENLVPNPSLSQGIQMIPASPWGKLLYPFLSDFLLVNRICPGFYNALFPFRPSFGVRFGSI